MNSYPAEQVLTVRELKSGDVMHCGLTGGKCMAWTVIDRDDKFAYVRVGETILKMTGREIRAGLPMYRATECPTCHNRKNLPNSVQPKIPTKYTNQKLEAANVASALSEVENVRHKNTNNSGGAAITSRKKYIAARTADILSKLMQGVKE